MMYSYFLFSKVTLLWLASAVIATCSSSSRHGKPNFVFIITDDQDLHLNSLDYMPNVQKHFGKQGSFYKRHYCTISICCPSRVSLLTGKAAHNTNVTDVSPPYGESARTVLIASLIFNRWLHKIHFARPQRQVSSSMATGCGIVSNSEVQSGCILSRYL